MQRTPSRTTTMAIPIRRGTPVGKEDDRNVSKLAQGIGGMEIASSCPAPRAPLLGSLPEPPSNLDDMMPLLELPGPSPMAEGIEMEFPKFGAKQVRAVCCGECVAWFRTVEPWTMTLGCMMRRMNAGDWVVVSGILTE
jgi:hypothetical protein